MKSRDPLDELLREQRRLTEVMNPVAAFESAALKNALRGASLADVFRKVSPASDLMASVERPWWFGLADTFRASALPRELLHMRDFFPPDTLVSASLDASVVAWARAMEILRRPVAALTKLDDALAALTWPDADEAGFASLDAPSVATQQTIRMDVELRCDRCGRQLFAQGHVSAVTSATSVRTNIRVIPWCRCMLEWNGTAEDLLRPKAAPSLILVEGDADGDGEPRGTLRIVRADDGDE